MMRLGFGARLFAIFVTSLVAVQLIAVAAFVLQRSRATDSGLRLPLPDQTAALVELLERSPREHWPLVLRAANSSELSVRIAENRQITREPAWYEAQLVDFIVRRYLSALGQRDVRVLVQPSSELLDGPLRLLAWASPGSVEIEVGLQSGEYVVVAAGGYLSLSILGLPPGFWAGLLGLAVAVLALALLRREARPLRQLAEAVDGMEIGLEARAIADAPRSAPEIRALIGAFNRLGERISALLRGRMALVGGISHDLRTYVTRLRLRAELIDQPAERAKAVADLDEMSRLLDDSLLAFSEGAPLPVEELVDVTAILAREAADRQAAGDAVALEKPSAPEAHVLGDPVALRRMLANIIDNAVKYGRDAKIRLERDDRALVVVVDDSGPGIPAGQRAALLEPFVRLERSRNRRTGGAGLGLAIARAVATSHGGTIALAEAPGGGARVRVTLPLYRVAGA
ncbi:MAG: sensor histidine kinase [Hyphomicrobiaceae bacterium]